MNKCRNSRLGFKSEIEKHMIIKIIMHIWTAATVLRILFISCARIVIEAASQQWMLLPLQLLWYNVDVHNSRSRNINSMTSLLNRKFCPPLVVSNHSILTQNYPAGMFFLPWQIGELNYYALIGATFVNSTKSVDICTMRGWWNACMNSSFRTPHTRFDFISCRIL